MGALISFYPFDHCYAVRHRLHDCSRISIAVDGVVDDGDCGGWRTHEKYRQDQCCGRTDCSLAGDALDGIQGDAVWTWDVLGQWRAVRLRDGRAYCRCERGTDWWGLHDGFGAVSGGRGGAVVLGDDSGWRSVGGDAPDSQGDRSVGECIDLVEQYSAIL